MSADVYIQVVRKSDGCPHERVYMGGNSLRNTVNMDYKLEVTVMGCYAHKFDNLTAIRKFIADNQDTISDYGGYPNEDDWWCGEDYHYWLVIEE